MSGHFWLWITGFGDALLTVPATVFVAILLAYKQHKNALIGWCCVVLLGASLVIISKAAFVGWGIGIAVLNFTGISGHAYSAAVILPIVFSWRKQNYGLGWWVGLAIAALVALSRVVLHAHSESEAIAGFMLGTIGSWYLASQYRAAFTGIVVWLPRILLVVLSFALYGKQAPTRDLITQATLSIAGKSTPYVREWQHKPTQ